MIVKYCEVMKTNVIKFYIKKYNWIVNYHIWLFYDKNGEVGEIVKKKN